MSNLQYTTQDLHDLFNQEKLVLCFQHSRQEQELSYYKQGKKINLTSKGWYTAHIKATGVGFDGISIKLFQRPDRIEYKNDRKIRNVNKDLSENELKVLKAHFLRLIHTFNSFCHRLKKQSMK